MAMSYDVKLKQTARVEGRYGNNNGQKKSNSINKALSNGDTKPAVVEMAQYGSTVTAAAATRQGRAFFSDDGNEYRKLTNDDDNDNVEIQQQENNNDDESAFNNKTLKVNEPPSYNSESALATGDPAVSRLAISDNDEELNVESNHVTTTETTNGDTHDCKLGFYFLFFIFHSLDAGSF